MRFTVGQRILIAFFVIIATSAGMIGYSLKQIAQVNLIGTRLARDDVNIMGMLQTVEDNQCQMRIYREHAFAVFALANSGSEVEEVSHGMTRWRNAKQQTTGGLEAIREKSLHHAETSPSANRAAIWRQLAEGASHSLAAMKEIGDEVEIDFSVIAQGDPAKVAERIGKIEEERRDFMDTIRAQSDLIRQIIDQGQIESQALYRDARLSVLVALGLVALFAVVVALWLHRSITAPLSAFMRFAERVGQGDLTGETDISGRDEFGDLGGHLNGMTHGLRGVATEARNVAENINSAALEILAAAQQRASAMSQQNASIQEITSTMAEISQSGRQVTERASKISNQAEKAAEAAHGGLDAVTKTEQVMEKIRNQAEAVAENIVALTEKTQSIGKIIATVNDISERAKLLAFNAAIEAVGGGEQGERFGVVAEEIKSLADQSKTATVQVKALLEDIQQGISSAVMLTEEAVKRVESGKSSSENTRKVVEDLATTVEQSVQTLQQIVAATGQQQIAVEQVTQSVQNIGAASEQMTVGTKDLEHAATNLTELGTALRDTIARYRL